MLKAKQPWIMIIITQTGQAMVKRGNGGVMRSGWILNSECNLMVELTEGA